MTDDKRLKHTLAKLAEPVDAAARGHRKLQATQTGDMIDAILGEIDNTVLARKLTLQNQSGDIIELEAANRRLICLASLSGDIAASPHKNIAGEVLSDTRTDLVEQLRQTLNGFAGDSRHLLVMASTSTGEFGPAEPGMSALALGKVWAQAAIPSELGPEIVGTFADACQKITTAELRLRAGDIELKRGEANDIELLIEMAAADQSGFRKNLAKCLTSKVSEAHLIVRSGPAGQNSIIFAIQGEHSVYMIMPSEKRFDSITIWQDLAAVD